MSASSVVYLRYTGVKVMEEISPLLVCQAFYRLVFILCSVVIPLLGWYFGAV